MSDAQLISAIAAGDADALGRLYDAHAAMVFGLAKRIVGRLEDAEEVVQAVFSQIWRDAARYEPSRATVAGWLVMLTRTRAIDKLRARTARPDANQLVDPAPILERRLSDAATPEALVLTHADAARVNAALEGLPPEQRRFLDLAYFQGLSQSEIAEQTQTPLGTVKTRMRTALQTLRAALST